MHSQRLLQGLVSTCSNVAAAAKFVSRGGFFANLRELSIAARAEEPQQHEPRRNEGQAAPEPQLGQCVGQPAPAIPGSWRKTRHGRSPCSACRMFCLGGARPCRRSTGPSMHAGQCQRADIARCQLTDGARIGTPFFANLSKNCRIISSRGDLCRNIAEARPAPFRLQKCPRCRGFRALVPAEHGPQLDMP
jgi:hypothetical protein